MIIFRYFTRDILLATLAVSSVLLLITMSTRFVKYLGQAAAGHLSADVLFSVMGYRLPGFLELILPLGFFIAVLLTYGRMYMESEMVVLKACGMSQRRIVSYTLFSAVFVALLTGALSVYVSPQGVTKAEAILDEQRRRSEFDTLKEARFRLMRKGQMVAYAEELNDSRTQLQQVFIADIPQLNAPRQNALAVLFAETGEQVLDEATGQRYLVLKQGRRYVGEPGTNNYQVTEFDSFAQVLSPPEHPIVKKKEEKAIATRDLWESSNPLYQAELQWRLSIPLLVIVVSLIAVPLSRTNPRQGRYAKMIPAILLYIVYLVLLSVARGQIEDGKLSPMLGMWVVHGLFVLVAIMLLSWEEWRFKAIAPPANPSAGNTTTISSGDKEIVDAPH